MQVLVKVLKYKYYIRVVEVVLCVIQPSLSYSTVVLYSRVGKKSQIFTPQKWPCNKLYLKNHLEYISTALMMQYVG